MREGRKAGRTETGEGRGERGGKYGEKERGSEKGREEREGEKEGRTGMGSAHLWILEANCVAMTRPFP